MNTKGGKATEEKVKGYQYIHLPSLLTARKATFVVTDISSWPSISKLFKSTFTKYGRIDVVAANAGIHGHERWLEDLMDSNGELEQPDFPAITVNLIGMLYSTHLSLEFISNWLRNWLCIILLRILPLAVH